MVAFGTKRAVFLDRDGVIVVPEFREGRSFAPRRLEDFAFYPDADASLRRFKDAGYLLVVVSNQPDVGAGLISTDVLEAMSRRLLARFPIDAIKICTHTRADNCGCRKPRAGLLLEASSELGIDCAASIMVGDRASDIAAGEAAGCRTVFIDRGYSAEPKPSNADHVVNSLAEAATIIVGAATEPEVKTVHQLKIKLFADGADFDGMMAMTKNPLVKGFTTNPTLMRKAGVTDYEAFARKVLAAIPDLPVSFEVFADDFAGMIEQAREIATWGPNVYVKIPVMNTQAAFTGQVVRTLSGEGVALNVTAVMTTDQVRVIADTLAPETPAIVSVFAGRVADTGRDPVPHMRDCLALLASRPQAELLWASPRELLNVFQADEAGCHIITATNDLIAKLALVGKDLTEYSRETVEMFYRDATSAGFNIEIKRPLEEESQEPRHDTIVRSRSGNRRGRVLREPASAAASGPRLQDNSLRRPVLRQ